VILTFNPINCSWEVSDIVGSVRVSKTYYGYTKDEVIEDFRAFIRYTEDPSYEPEDITVNR
jgi:hypothetical protein